MSTVEDFENAPVGATATDADGNRAMKTDLGEWCWVFQNGDNLDDELMERRGYTLDPSAPTSAREALDLAWELAYPVKEGQIIPEGTRYVEGYSYGVGEYTAHMDFKLTPGAAPNVRTLEPLPDPDPEPDWQDAPAVLATCYGCDEDGQVQSVYVPSFRWWRCTVCTSDVSWMILDDVIPLYPKGQDS